MSREVPLAARHATEEIQAQRLKLRKGVNCEVRFRQQTQTGDPTSLRKLMPLRLAHGPKLQILDDLIK